MILFYNAFVYLEVITEHRRVRGSFWDPGQWSRQAIYHMICLLRGKAFGVASATINNSRIPWRRDAQNRFTRVGTSSSRLIPKRAGPIIKGNSFVLAWHLKDRHLVSRQRRLCRRGTPLGPGPAHTFLRTDKKTHFRASDLRRPPNLAHNYHAAISEK